MKDNCPWSVTLPLSNPLHYISYPGVTPNRYIINDYGLVFDTIKGREISQFINGGFYKCNLVRVDGSQFSYSIHRLVAWEFCPGRNFNFQINHIDGNKLNNNYWNLDWVIPATTSNVTRSSRITSKVTRSSPRIISYPGVRTHTYSITNSGVITNVISGSTLSQNISNSGYYQCGLIGVDGKQHMYSVHRLVGWEWVLKNRDFNLQINHKDGNKLNNNYWNLEWVTPSENARHAVSMGLTKIGEDHPMAKLTDNDVHRICYYLQDPKISYDQIAEMFKDKVVVGTIISIAHGDTWTHISRLYKIPHREWEYPNGVDHIWSKLTEEEVHEICQMLLDPSVTYKEVAERFEGKISTSGVNNIAAGFTYTSISSKYNIPPRENDRLKISRLSCKLDVDKVHKICQMLQDPRIMYKDIAAKFDVTDHNILDIAHGNIWADVSSQYVIPDRSSKNHTTKQKLTVENVHEICRLLQDTTMTHKQIAAQFCTNVSNIQAIANGYNWTDISSKYNIPRRGVTKLKAEDVEVICEMLQNTNKTFKEIGAMFGVSGENISWIAKGKSWTDISKHYNFSSRIKSNRQ